MEACSVLLVLHLIGPDPSLLTLMTSSCDSQRVIVQEEFCGDVEGSDYINGVVFVCCQHEEHFSEISVLRNKKCQFLVPAVVKGRRGKALTSAWLHLIGPVLHQ